jgi:protein phosphatase
MRCLREANGAVLRVAEKISPRDELGTTLVAAVLHESCLYWVSCGDSRIYLARGKFLTRLTSDHTLARELNQQAVQGQISLAAAQSHPERGSLTSYLGQHEIALVDRNPHPLAVRPDDCIILCSDGLYRALTEEEIADAFREDPQRACDRLVQRALAKRRKQQDNLTIIALKHPSRIKRLPQMQRGTRRLQLAALAILLLSLATGSGFLVGRYLSRGNGKPTPVGRQTPVVKATPTPSPVVLTPTPSGTVIINPQPSPTPVSTPTPQPTSHPTPRPTPKPAPKPTP